MIDIGITYYSNNPKPKLGYESNNDEKVDKLGILDKYIKVSEIDENVLQFININYINDVRMSFNVNNKSQCENVIKALEIIKNNLRQ